MITFYNSGRLATESLALGGGGMKFVVAAPMAVLLVLSASSLGWAAPKREATSTVQAAPMDVDHHMVAGKTAARVAKFKESGKHLHAVAKALRVGAPAAASSHLRARLLKHADRVESLANRMTEANVNQSKGFAEEIQSIEADLKVLWQDLLTEQEDAFRAGFSNATSTAKP
jgi:hypothetical protein